MISHNIKWFLGLSVAVHTAALVTWSPHEHQAGHSGQVLLLSVSDRTGTVIQSQQPAASQPAAIPVTSPPRPPARRLPLTTVVKQQQAAPVTLPPRVKPAATTRQQHSTPQPRQAVQTTQAAITAQAASAVTRENQDQHLRTSVMDLIAQKLSYPAIARRKGWQGIVRLELHIEADGRISDLHIDETSGYSVLDEAALQSLQLANVPDAAQWLRGRAIDMVVPVEYRLIDG